MKALVVHNRAAGGAGRKRLQLEEALSLLEGAGWELDVRLTASKGHATQLAAEAVSASADVVVAAGGDGTVNEVLQALVHSETALAVFPIGTVNVWAREAGFSTDVVRAAAELTQGRRVRVDAGRAGARYFLLMAGVGLDAEVTASLGSMSRRKQRLGVLPYLWRTAQVVPRYRGAMFEIEFDDQTTRQNALMVLASNTRLYAGLGRPAPAAVANDGMLDVTVFAGRGPAQTVRHIARFLWQSKSPRFKGDVTRVRRLAIRSDPPSPVQIDGEPAGTTPIEITVEPRSVVAIVPSQYDTSLIDPSHDG